jgi:two-component system response regulator BaeR
MTRVVFVVEDDRKIADVLRDYLIADGYAPRLFADGSGVLAALEEAPPAAMILDLMLPGMSGFAICERARAFSAVPILMLTARVDEIDRLKGLGIGADDYVSKPFSAREVMARVAALIRRAEGRVTSVVAEARPYAVDEAGRRIAWRGHWLALSPAEYAITAAMMQQPGRVFSRDQLLDRLGERADTSSDRAIDSHIKNIRKKFASVDAGAACIASVYGTGYRFEP